jgi:hypothetical protein
MYSKRAYTKSSHPVAGVIAPEALRRRKRRNIPPGANRSTSQKIETVSNLGSGGGIKPRI